jgi:hypothetical protein
MRKKLYIAINRNIRRSECMCRLGIQRALPPFNPRIKILWINNVRALSGTKEGVNL